MIRHHDDTPLSVKFTNGFEHTYSTWRKPERGRGRLRSTVGSGFTGHRPDRSSLGHVSHVL